MRNTAWVGASQLAKVVLAVLSLSVPSRLVRPTLIAPEAGPAVRIIGASVAAGVAGAGASMALPAVRGLVLAVVRARRKHA